MLYILQVLPSFLYFIIIHQTFMHNVFLFMISKLERNVKQTK